MSAVAELKETGELDRRCRCRTAPLPRASDSDRWTALAERSKATRRCTQSAKVRFVGSLKRCRWTTPVHPHDLRHRRVIAPSMHGGAPAHSLFATEPTRGMFMERWSHPPGSNRRPADYETSQSSQIVENAIHRPPFALATERVAAQVEQVSEQVSAPTARGNTTAAEVEQVHYSAASDGIRAERTPTLVVHSIHARAQGGGA